MTIIDTKSLFYTLDGGKAADRKRSAQVKSYEHTNGCTEMEDAKITVEVVRQRAAVAGVKLDEDTFEEVADAMEKALAPLRELDLRAIRLVEPAVGFKAAWSE